jgi:HEAT repeat protein
MKPDSRRRMILQDQVRGLIERKTTPEGTKRLLANQVWGRDRQEQREAIAKLGHFQKKELGKLMPALAFAAQDYDIQVRQHALNALANVGGKKVQPLLIRALRDSEGKVVVSAIHALAKAGDKNCVPALIRLYEGGKNLHLIAGTLALKHDKRAVPTIKKHLTEGKVLFTEDVPMLLNAIKAFEPELVKPVVFRLLAHRNEHHRMAAADFLGDYTLELAKNNPELKKKLELTREKFRGLSEDRKGILLYAIAANKISQSQIPVDWEKADRTQRQFVLALKKQAKESSLIRILDIFGLRTPKKKKGRK